MAIDMKRVLADALIELVQEKPLAKITVSDIVLQAHTGRQTFYNHFRDKNDLIYWIFLGTLPDGQLMETAGYYVYLSEMIRLSQKNSRFYIEACKLAGQNSLAEAIYLQTYKSFKKYILKHYGEAVVDEQIEFALMFNAYGNSNLFVRWAEAGMPGRPEQQARYAIHCMPPCLKEYMPLNEEEKAF